MDTSADTQITAQRILRELGAIAFTKTTDLLEIRDGQLVVADTGDISQELARAMASVEKTSGGVKVKFYDKLKALELLGKAVGLFDGGAVQQEENGLLEAILEATKGELDGGTMEN